MTVYGISVIAWDLDGTLYPLDETTRKCVNERIYQKIHKEKGWSLERCIEEFHSRADRLHTATGALVDLGFSRETMQKCMEESNLPDVLHYDEKLVEMFRKLESYRHILVTGNTRRLSVEIIKRLGIEGRFERMITSDDVRNGKPHPESYERLIECTSIPAANHVWVDDRLDHVLVAKGFGIKTVLVGGVPTDKTDIWVPKVYDVPQKLDELASALAANE
ncbi:MAG: HAD-IA family hydrolase [Candidatus Aenigmarchaeota archaeon]|nr:HAD-IA family hydrolase [Candidatus Aenigmarchaeota archaeon]